MKVLFIGGTGNISTPCTAMAIEKGYEVYLLNRGKTTRHPVPTGATVINADIRNREETAEALKNYSFDVVVDWIAFNEPQIETDIGLFGNRIRQYIFISSASVYQKPLTHPVITESTPACNPYWDYSQNKINCENRLLREYRENGFPVTIVRPSHTYDTVIPVSVGNWDYTIADRMLRGKEIIIHGDGTSLWTATHALDFAKGFTGLLGNIQAIGHAFHITSDEVLTWNQIYSSIADAVGVKASFVYIPSDFIGKHDAFTGANLLGDKAVSAIFDNSKIKRFVPEFKATIPFSQGIRRTIAWFNADEKRKSVDAKSNAFMDKTIEAYKRAW